MRGNQLTESPMTRDEFRQLFLDVLEEAAVLAEIEHNIEIPRRFEIEMHGLGYNLSYPFEYMNVDTALDALYLDENSFIPLIDVFVKSLSRKREIARVFVRPSPRELTPFQHTWNYKLGKGPFKLMIAMNLRILED